MANGEMHQITRVIVDGLGKAAPWTIIAALFVIALYFFREQEFTQREKETVRIEQRWQKRIDASQRELEDARDDAKHAREEALKTRAHYEEITDRQIKRIERLLDLSEKIEQERDDESEELQKLQLEVVNHKANIEKLGAEAKEFEEQVRIAERQMQEDRRLLDDHERTLRYKEQELASKERELAAAEETQDRLKKERVDQITNLTGQLSELAKAVQEGVESPPEDITQMVNAILGHQIKAKQQLSDYAENPSELSIRALKSLVGMEFDGVLELVKELKDGFSYAFTFVSNESSAIILSAKRSEFGYDDLLVIRSQAGKVDDVDGLVEPIRLVSLRDLDDWSITYYYLVFGTVNIERIPATVQGWTWLEVVESVGPDEDFVSLEVIPDVNGPVPILGAAEFKRAFRGMFDSLDAFHADEFILQVEAGIRAESFGEDSIAGGGLLPDDLYSRFRTLAKAGISGDVSEVRNLLDDSLDVDVLGRLTATILKDEFSIAGVREDPEVGKAILVECIFRDGRKGDVHRRLELSFRNDPMKGGWILTGLSAEKALAREK